MKLHKKKSSIFVKILLPMVVVAALQSAVFLGIIMLGGIAGEIDRNAYDKFSQQVSHRRDEYENQMNRWMDIENPAEHITSLYEAYKTKSMSKTDFLLDLNPALVDTLRQNKVTGVFFILSGDNYALPTEDAPQLKHGVCIRDLDPDTANRNNGDIILNCAPASVATKMGFALDSWWESTYTFTGAEASDYYYKPLLAATEHTSREPLDYQYWSRPHQVAGKGTEVISFSVPLFDATGIPFGVLGIELATDYIKNFLPSTELGAEDTGVYILAERTGETTFQPLASNGYMYTRYFGEGERITLPENSIADHLYDVRSAVDDRDSIVSVAEIFTYNKTSPFSDSPVCLLGIIDKSELLRFSHWVRVSLIVAALGTFLISIAGAFISGKIFSTPIKRLVGKVRGGRGNGNRSLGRVNIYEIDELIQAIEQLNMNVSNSENKISEIIRVSGLTVGTFEVDKRKNCVFISPEFLEIMGEAFGDGDRQEGLEPFNKRIDAIQQYRVSRDIVNHSDVYHFPQSDKWVRVKMVNNSLKRLGIALDVTAEMQDREKIEYERDHDILTELMNRRAFHKTIDQLFEAPEMLGVAAMVMMDVDNLKHVNDSFGHDCGDNYLRKVAITLKTVESVRSVVSRISGDEFIVFFHGYESKDQILEEIDKLHLELAEAFLWLPNNEKMRIRLSGGIAWYPENSREQNSLIKFADFAMLQTKKHHKGNFDVFESEEYRKNRYLVESVDEINRLIDDNLVDFFFQPIVDIRHGEIYAYEALMRPQGETISGPAEALSLAAAIGSLYQMERLTWLNVMKKFEANLGLFAKGSKLFINSIPNQCLSDSDYEFVIEQYGLLLNRVVVEVTENEKLTLGAKEIFTKLSRSGVRLALDDYGTGYNGQMMLLDLAMDYVKIDMSIVRGVSADVNRQEVIRTIVNYAKERKIKIIAEGVETQEELNALYMLGVEYVQGYLLQKPVPLPLALSEEAVNAIHQLSE